MCFNLFLQVHSPWWFDGVAGPGRKPPPVTKKKGWKKAAAKAAAQRLETGWPKQRGVGCEIVFRS